MVLDAAKALEAANASGDAQKIRAAMAGARRRPCAARRRPAAVVAWHGGRPLRQNSSPTQRRCPSVRTRQNLLSQPEKRLLAPDAAADVGTDGRTGSTALTRGGAVQAELPPGEPPKPAPKPVVAMRGDDRPGMKKAEAALPGRGGKFGDRKDGPARCPAAPGRQQVRTARAIAPRARRAMTGALRRPPAFEDRGPRLGDAAFRAQREALEHAEAACASWPRRRTARR